VGAEPGPFPLSDPLTISSVMEAPPPPRGEGTNEDVVLGRGRPPNGGEGE